MDTALTSPGFFREALHIWFSGGWLMAPLLILTVYIYFVALQLLIELNGVYLLRHKANRMSDAQIEGAFGDAAVGTTPVLLKNTQCVETVQRHFLELRNEFLPAINRRIRFLSITSSTGPLLGLLGTVTGMLSTFDGMSSREGDKFDSMVSGISEALITTQSGLIITIPCFVLIALIIRRRNDLERSLSSLERYNARQALKRSGKRSIWRALPLTAGDPV